MHLHAAWWCWANISWSSCTCLAAAVVAFSVIKWIILFCRFWRWVGWLWVLRLWWCSSWLCSCCTDMETLRSSSAWCCLARCWPGICASSSSLFYLWTSARSVPVQVIKNLLFWFDRCSLNATCAFILSTQTIYNQCKIDREQKSVSTFTPLPTNHTTSNGTATPTKRLEKHM